MWNCDVQAKMMNSFLRTFRLLQRFQRPQKGHIFSKLGQVSNEVTESSFPIFFFFNYQTFFSMKTSKYIVIQGNLTQEHCYYCENPPIILLTYAT